MPATTPTYGITYPVSTDKVADGAAAIQSTAETVERELTALDNRTVSTTGGDTITASAATVIPLTVKGAASQTANLFEARDSAGTALVTIQNTGTIVGPDPTTTSYLLHPTNGQQNRLAAKAAGNIPLVVRGAASQTASLTEWHSSAGTALTSIQADGRIRTGVGLTLAGASVIALQPTLVGGALGTFQGTIRVNIDGTDYRIPYYT